MPTISIITPAYNCEKYLEEAVESVLAQTMQDWEMLIIDDCSSDNTYACMEKLAQRDKRIRIFRNTQNAGAAATRNYGSARRKASGLHSLTVMTCGEKRNCRNRWLSWRNTGKPLFYLLALLSLKMME